MTKVIVFFVSCFAYPHHGILVTLAKTTCRHFEILLMSACNMAFLKMIQL